MLARLRQCFCVLMLLTGLAWLMQRLRGLTGDVVLVYHEIGARRYDDVFPPNIVSVETFQRHLEMLARLFDIVSLDQLLAEPGTPSRRRAALTFDDGYRGVLEHAWPVLRARGWPMTVFVVTRLLADDACKWEDAYTEDRLGGEDSANIAASAISHEVFRVAALPAHARRAMLSRFDLDAISLRPARLRYLTAQDVTTLTKEGVQFGSHGHTHLALEELSELERRYELETSKRALEAITQYPVRFLAYPLGDSRSAGPASYRAAEATGYHAAFTNRTGGLKRGQNRFALPRVRVEEGSVAEFRCALMGVTDLWDSAVRCVAVLWASLLGPRRWDHV